MRFNSDPDPQPCRYCTARRYSRTVGGLPTRYRTVSFTAYKVKTCVRIRIGLNADQNPSSYLNAAPETGFAVTLEVLKHTSSRLQVHMF
jgi:hypothetical protein